METKSAKEALQRLKQGNQRLLHGEAKFTKEKESDKNSVKNKSFRIIRITTRGKDTCQFQVNCYSSNPPKIRCG